MFERFTDRARQTIVLTQQEARMLNHNYIGTEHILLGLIAEGEGVACKALEALGISLDGVRRQVEEIIGVGMQAAVGHIPFTPRAKRVLELSLREALQLGHNYIGTEHVLLGLVREGDGVGAQVLEKLGVELTSVRKVVIQILSGYVPKPAPAVTPPNEEFLQNLRDAGVPITDKKIAFTVEGGGGGGGAEAKPAIAFGSNLVTGLSEPAPVKLYEVYLVEGPDVEGPCWIAVSKPKGPRAGIADNPQEALDNLIASEDER